MAQQGSSDHDGPRGDQTRQRLLETAVEIFAHNAYDSVRTRTLADAAGVNQAAIPYYFGGKEGLYLAVAQRIAQELDARTRELRLQVQQTLRRQPPAGRDEILHMLGELLYTFARNTLERAEQSTIMAFMVREQLHPTKAFDLIYTQALQPLHATISALIARLRDLAQEDPRCILQAHALLGQVVIFVAARAALLRRLGVEKLQASQVEEIAQLVSTLAKAPFSSGTSDTLAQGSKTAGRSTAKP